MDVLHALGLDESSLDSVCVVVQEYHGADGGFLLQHLLSVCVKRGFGLCLLLLHHSFGHYHNAGMRLGHNLLHLKERGLLVAVEGLRLVLQDEDNALRPDEESESPSGPLFQKVKSAVEQLTSAGCGKVCLFVDDLSDLLALGFAPRDVLAFERTCTSYLHRLGGLGVVMAHCDQEDEEQSQLGDTMGYSADVVVQVVPLSTGSSREVSGSLVVTGDSGSRKTWHYKSTEKGARVFAPGMASGLL